MGTCRSMCTWSSAESNILDAERIGPVLGGLCVRPTQRLGIVEGCPGPEQACPGLGASCCRRRKVFVAHGLQPRQSRHLAVTGPSQVRKTPAWCGAGSPRPGRSLIRGKKSGPGLCPRRRFVSGGGACTDVRSMERTSPLVKPGKQATVRDPAGGPCWCVGCRRGGEGARTGTVVRRRTPPAEGPAEVQQDAS